MRIEFGHRSIRLSISTIFELHTGALMLLCFPIAEVRNASRRGSAFAFSAKTFAKTKDVFQISPHLQLCV